MSERIFLLRHNYIFYCSQVGQIFALRLLFHFLLRCRTVEYESQQYQCHDHPSGQCCCSQTCKFIIVTFQIDHNDNRRNAAADALNNLIAALNTGGNTTMKYKAEDIME